MECQRHGKPRDEDNVWIFTSLDQLCSGDEGSVSKIIKINVTETRQCHVADWRDFCYFAPEFQCYVTNYHVGS